VIDVPFKKQHAGVPVIGSKTAPRNRPAIDHRDQVLDALLGRAFTDIEVHPAPQFLPGFVKTG
jgi:hypothetical protein